MKASIQQSLIALAVVASLQQAFAQGTAFTYQGRLNDGANPANGKYDFQFQVFDAPTAGTSYGNPTPNNITGVGVTNGLFTVTLDFGTGVFTGPARWLQTSVRTNGNGSFTTLSPRSGLLPLPYAIMANNASNLLGTLPAGKLSGAVLSGSLSGTYGNPVSFNNPGNTFVGNGTGLVGINSATLDGLAAGNFWQVGGNGGTTAGVNFIGTTDNQPLELKVSGQRALRLEPNSSFAPNVIGGSISNSVSAGAIGGTIAGGGQNSFLPLPGGVHEPNTITSDFGSVGGGSLNSAGNFGTVPGGYNNSATGNSSFAAGEYAHADTDDSFVWNDDSSGPVSSTGPYQFIIHASGGVGIGTSIPAAQLHVYGNSAPGTNIPMSTAILTSGDGFHNRFMSANDNQAVYFSMFNGGQGDYGELSTYDYGTGQGLELKLNANGGTVSVPVLEIRGGSDLAEPFQMSDQDIPKGAVVVIDEERPGRLKMSTRAYDSHVAGIVSGANGINPGISLHQEGTLDGGNNVALSGRVYALADACNGVIKAGDLLTTSDRAGLCMKASDHGRAQGAVIGKAMSSLEKGQGLVLVLVSLQ